MVLKPIERVANYNPEHYSCLNYAMIGVFMDKFKGKTLSYSVRGLIDNLPKVFQEYVNELIAYIDKNIGTPFNVQPGKIPANFATFIEFCKENTLFLELLAKGKAPKQIDFGQLIVELSDKYNDFKKSMSFQEMKTVLKTMENSPLNEFK